MPRGRADAGHRAARLAVEDEAERRRFDQQLAAAIDRVARALWAGLEMGRLRAVGISDVLTRLGNDPSALEAGQEKFASGSREPWRLR